MNTTLKFYTNPQSRGRTARWMLEEIGAPYEAVILDYRTTMKAPEYLAINPMGKVPALVHGTQVVTECAAICAYLADAFPEAGLAPDPDHRGAYYRWLFFAAGPLEAAIINRALQVEVTTDQQGFVGYGNYDLTLDVLEQSIRQHSYLAGDRFTAADVYLGSQIGWGLRFGSIDPRPAFTDYWARISERPARLRASAMDDALIAAKDKP